MSKIALLEGLLYLAGEEGLSEKELCDIMEVSNLELGCIVEQYQQKLNEDSGIQVVYLANTYKLIANTKYNEYYKKLIGNDSFKLSDASLETLAIIAYNQPVTRLEIEQIRGVSCDNILRKLLAKSLIEISGRKECAGTPLLYQVSDLFLDYFNLKSLSELPELKIVKEEEDQSNVLL